MFKRFIFLVSILALAACSSKQQNIQRNPSIRVIRVQKGPQEYEQRFVNFLALIQREQDSIVVAASVDTLLAQAQKQEELSKILDLSYHYLYDPNSPLYDEDTYLFFLNSYCALPGTSEAEKERTSYTIRDIRANRPGTLPPDFEFTFRSGATSTLRRFAKGVAPTLLVFYDPECDNCAEIIDLLHNDPALQELTQNAMLRVLAIYTEGQPDVWRKHKDYIPAEWTDVCVTRNPDEVLTLYNLRARPTLYLIAPDGTIILKDAQPEQLLQIL